MWTIEAPAFAASIAVLAICSGVTAQWGLFVTLVSSPVTAQVMMTSWFMVASGDGVYGGTRSVRVKYYRDNNIASLGVSIAMARRANGLRESRRRARRAAVTAIRCRYSAHVHG